MRKDDISLVHLSELLATEKAASGKSAETVSWYTGVIARYADWLVAQDLEPTLGAFTLEQVRAYIVALQGLRARALHPLQPTENRPLSDATINSYVRALRAFSNWLFEEGYTVAPPIARLKAPRMTQKTQKTQKVLTEAEIASIVCALNPRTEIGDRDQAIFLLLLDPASGPVNRVGCACPSCIWTKGTRSCSARGGRSGRSRSGHAQLKPSASTCCTGAGQRSRTRIMSS